MQNATPETVLGDFANATVTAAGGHDVLLGLVAIARNSGDFPTALRYGRELAALSPGDTRLRRLIGELERLQTP
jgi:hypothetical protein